MNCRCISAGVTQRVLLALNKERKERPPPLTRLPPLDTGDPGCQRGGSRRPHPGPLLQLPPRPRDAQQPKFHHQKQPRWVNKLVLLTSNAPLPTGCSCKTQTLRRARREEERGVVRNSLLCVCRVPDESATLTASKWTFAVATTLGIFMAVFY